MIRLLGEVSFSSCEVAHPLRIKIKPIGIIRGRNLLLLGMILLFHKAMELQQRRVKA